MRRPYDLVALLRQEERAGMLNTLKKELLLRKEEIDRNEDKDSGMCFIMFIVCFKKFSCVCYQCLQSSLVFLSLTFLSDIRTNYGDILHEPAVPSRDVFQINTHRNKKRNHVYL